jgi:hypothetical protein
MIAVSRDNATVTVQGSITEFVSRKGRGERKARAREELILPAGISSEEWGSTPAPGWALVTALMER